MRIFLIGFMGSGKSHVGRQLAASTGMDFLDLDVQIEKDQQRSIRQIFEQEGEATFRQIERDALFSMAQQEHAIIACGGGTPCFFDNMDWMNRNGITIYLQTPVSILVQRLKPEKAHRPLLQNLDDEGLHIFIRAKLAERVPFYLRASVIYQVKDANEDVAAALIKQFSNITGH